MTTSSAERSHPPAPDVTEAVMHRLGFEPATAPLARRQRLVARIRSTVFVIALLGLAVGAGLRERVNLEWSMPGSVETARTDEPARASLLGGLSTPLNRLEDLLDRSETVESGPRTPELDPACFHGPTRSGELLPLLVEPVGGCLPFPRS